MWRSVIENKNEHSRSAGESNSDSISFEHHIVALVDVLNQKDSMRVMNSLPQTPSEKDHFCTAVKQTVGIISQIHTSFRRFFDEYRDGAPPGYPVEKLTDEQRELVVAIGNREAPRFQNFSDTMIIHQVLSDTERKPSPRPVYTFFGCCTGVIIASLASRVAVRGAIDVGVGSECWEGEIYGPVLAAAHELESEVAQYPRIVVGGSLIAYLRSFMQQEGENLLSDWNRIIAEACLGMIALDNDGTPFLDYLGQGVRQAFRGAVTGIAGDVQNAFAFVRTEHERFEDAGDEKLARRYAELRAYFESRSVLWRQS